MQQQYIFAPIYFIGRRKRFLYLSRVLNCSKIKMKFFKYSIQTDCNILMLSFCLGLRKVCSIAILCKFSV